MDQLQLTLNQSSS